ncbi:MAG: TIGR03085 family metal-binding protein [Nocardioidaceae bacterium]
MSDLVNAYTDLATQSHGPAVSLVERAQLCNLFEHMGPEAPTLSGEWDCHHLAAHLVVREGTPLGFLKVIRPTVGNEEVEQLVQTRSYPSLVEAVRSGPPKLTLFGVPQIEALGNTVEFFIHHEDVRRAADGWSARELPPWAEDQLWSRLRYLARGSMRTAPIGVQLERSDNGERARVAKRANAVVVRGLPSELALYASGRSDVADVELHGRDIDIDVLGQARFGF